MQTTLYRMESLEKININILQPFLSSRPMTKVVHTFLNNQNEFTATLSIRS